MIGHVIHKPFGTFFFETSDIKSLQIACPAKFQPLKKIIKPHSSPCNQELLEKKSPGVPGSDKDTEKWDPFIFCWLKKTSELSGNVRPGRTHDEWTRLLNSQGRAKTDSLTQLVRLVAEWGSARGRCTAEQAENPKPVAQKVRTQR